MMQVWWMVCMSSMKGGTMLHKSGPESGAGVVKYFRPDVGIKKGMM